MTLKSICLFCLLSFTVLAKAQQRVSEVTIKTDSLFIKLSFYSPGIVRIIKSKTPSLIIKDNFSIEAKPNAVVIKKQAQKNSILIATDSLTIRIIKETGAISFSRNQQLLTEEDPSVQPQFGKIAANNETRKIKQGFILAKDEPIYGLGQHQKGTMNQRNQMQLLSQNNMEIAIPAFQSLKGYAILWNNDSPTLFADTLHQTYFLSDKGSSIDYFFIWGGNTDGVVRGIRYLSGQSPLLPRWAFGFVQSKERYQSQEEVVDVVKKYRQLSVPLDCIVQDWRYWGMDWSDWNSTEFGNPAFNKAQAMIDSVHKLNARIIISVWPSFGVNTKIYKELDEKGYLINDKIPDFPKDAKVYNAFNSNARNIVWKYMNKNIFSKGIDGWWLDATEPFERSDFVNNIYSPFNKHMKPLITEAADTIAAEANSYPLYTVSGVAVNQRRVTSGKRVFILTRSAYIGQQRYGAIVWSGDISSSWGTLRNQISGGINLGLCGIPYWNTDIGGFWSKRFSNSAPADPAFRELVVRWLQFGTFTALMRLHGTDAPREIYQYGKKGTWAYDAVEKFINFRYRLLPYTYTTSYNIMHNQASLMRPLFADFKEDTATYNINDQFLYGTSFLIAPVTIPQYIDTTNGLRKENFAITKSRCVYLPEGTAWFDFWTGEKYAGGRYITCPTPIDIMPVFVRSGSIIPLGAYKQYSDEKADTAIEIRIYPGADSKFTLYEDEGDNYNYEKGQYATIDFTWQDHSQKLTISAVSGQYRGYLKKRTFNIVIVNKGKGVGIAPAVRFDHSVLYGNKNTTISFAE